jgi:competence protein ComEA
VLYERGDGVALDVNTASREELIELTGIAEEIADAIIDARPFNSIDDLIAIPGIGQRTLERLKGQGLTVGSVEGSREDKDDTNGDTVESTKEQQKEEQMTQPRRTQREIEEEIQRLETELQEITSPSAQRATTVTGSRCTVTGSAGCTGTCPCARDPGSIA